MGVDDCQCSGLASWPSSVRSCLWGADSTSGHHKIWTGTDAGARDGSSFGRPALRSGYALADVAGPGRLLGCSHSNAKDMGTERVWSDPKSCPRNDGIT